MYSPQSHIMFLRIEHRIEHQIILINYEFILNYDYIQNKRQKLEKLDPNYDSSHFYQKSIVIEYFLKIKHEYHRIKE